MKGETPGQRAKRIMAWRLGEAARVEGLRRTAKESRAAEREERLRATAVDPSPAYTRFETEQAAQMNIAIEELRSRKERNRAVIRAPGQLVYSPDHKIL